MDRIYQQHWMSLDKATRDHLSKALNISTSGISEIRDQEVLSDGKTNEDLSFITNDKLNEYIGSVELFPRAWELTLAKARYELNPPIDLSSFKMEAEVVEDNQPEAGEQNDKKDKKGK